MMDWSCSSKTGSAPRFLSFGTSQQDHLLPSRDFTPTSFVDQNQRTHYSSLQEVRMFPISSEQNQTTITTSMSEPQGKSFNNNFINPQSLRRSPIMAHPVSVFPSPTNIRSSFKPVPAQLTIFYAGSVSVYQDISPEKAQAIMLLAGNGPLAKPVSMPKPQKLVHHSPATTYPPTMTPSFMPSMSYIVSGSNDASNIASAVCLPQTRKASLARFMEKRKERVIKVSPYYMDNKSSIECSRTPISECVSSSLSSSSEEQVSRVMHVEVVGVVRKSEIPGMYSLVHYPSSLAWFFLDVPKLAQAIGFGEDTIYV